TAHRDDHRLGARCGRTVSLSMRRGVSVVGPRGFRRPDPFVERVKPKKVLTLHGFAEDFARTLRERGIEAWAIGRDNQLDLLLPSQSAQRVEVPPVVPQPAQVFAANDLAA